MRVLFWGTPAFAVPALRALLGEGFEVIGAVTQPDKPQGRSRSTVVASPVKEVALGERLPVFQPERPRDPEFLEMLGVMAPDVSVVVAYGHILPAAAIDARDSAPSTSTPRCCPICAGAAPIQAAIREGLTETGVTIMRMVPALDAGRCVLGGSTPMHVRRNVRGARARLSELGAQALVERSR
jgi:methionyl-tRNA formyltransferase